MRSGSITSRPWSGPDDVGAAGALLSAAWAGPSRPLVPATIGDLEWWIAQGGPDADWSNRIRIWSVDGSDAAWGWFKPPTSLDWFVRPGLGEQTDAAVRDAMLAWHAERARDSTARGTGTPSRETPVLDTWAADSWPEAAFLRSRGWSVAETALTQYLQPLDLPIDPGRLPDGYRVRTLRGVEDLPARVEAHRAAFAPSKLTVEKYEILVRQPHYAFDRDVVVEAPDGSFAAFAMVWADPAGSIGEFEPVGTHPDHQRRGLGRVVMRHGLQLLRAAGIRDAMVFSLASNAASEALYQSSGFSRGAIHREYRKPLA